jgi:hypothetical protein
MLLRASCTKCGLNIVYIEPGLTDKFHLANILLYQCLYSRIYLKRRLKSVMMRDCENNMNSHVEANTVK